MLSVIVPVYQSSAHLRRCVDSILAQSYTDFELLLIDDGSTDGSGVICDDYAARDRRVRVFHKDNGGVSSARQLGLEQSRGEYVIHVDSDDWVEAHMLETLYGRAQSDDADLVICDYYLDAADHQEYVSQRPSSLGHATVLEELFHHLEGYCWNKLVRRRCCQDYALCFPRELFLCEDLYFHASLLRHPIKVSYLPQAFYHYVRGVNVHSITDCYGSGLPTRETFLYEQLLYDKFTTLLRDSHVYPLVASHFGFSVVYHAFWGHFFTSRQFRECCHRHRHTIRARQLPAWQKLSLYLSCIGLYTPVYGIVTHLKHLKSTLTHNS